MLSSFPAAVNERSLSVLVGPQVSNADSLCFFANLNTQRFPQYYFALLFTIHSNIPLSVAVPLDRGLLAYKTVDDLRSTLYVRDWLHCRHVQALSRGRVLVTRNPEDNTFTYAIYYEDQDDMTNGLNHTLSTSRHVWRGNVLVVRLDTDGGRKSATRGLPIHMDLRDRLVARAVVLM